MAKFDYSSYESNQSNRNTNRTPRERSKVGYFSSLKNDGDEAIVRFAYTSPSEFEIVTVHNVMIDDKWRRISCLRNNIYEPIDNCPLCAKGERLFSKLYVKLIEYTRDDSGNIVAQAKVWERPAQFAKVLKGYFDEYGDISNMIFKVKRHGEKGCLQTSYDVIPANQNIYKPEIYVKDFSDFENLDLSHHSYMNKTYEEMETFVQTGKFPMKSANNSNNQNVSMHNADTPFETPFASEPTPNQQTYNVSQSEARPRRVYEY